jgi:hypothetical protein
MGLSLPDRRLPFSRLHLSIALSASHIFYNLAGGISGGLLLWHKRISN